MKLSELEPRFIKLSENTDSFRTDVMMQDCDGLMFLCPKCFIKNEGPIGTYVIICWQPHVPLMAHLTGPGRWRIEGTSAEDLSLVANSSSVLLADGCKAHFLIRKGDIVMC